MPEVAAQAGHRADSVQDIAEAFRRVLVEHNHNCNLQLRGGAEAPKERSRLARLEFQLAAAAGVSGAPLNSRPGAS